MSVTVFVIQFPKHKPVIIRLGVMFVFQIPKHKPVIIQLGDESTDEDEQNDQTRESPSKGSHNPAPTTTFSLSSLDSFLKQERRAVEMKHVSTHVFMFLKLSPRSDLFVCCFETSPDFFYFFCCCF